MTETVHLAELTRYVTILAQRASASRRRCKGLKRHAAARYYEGQHDAWLSVRRMLEGERVHPGSVAQFVAAADEAAAATAPTR